MVVCTVPNRNNHHTAAIFLRSSILYNALCCDQLFAIICETIQPLIMQIFRNQNVHWPSLGWD